MSRTWEREVSAQIESVVGMMPPVGISFENERPVCGPVVPGRVRPGPSAPLAAGSLPYADATQPAMLVNFVGSAASGVLRARLLAETKRALARGGRLLLIDHNRPRRRLAALLALLADPRPPGGRFATRWRRLGHPTAREAQAAGFVVDLLRLAVGERVQLVVARPEGDV